MRPLQVRKTAFCQRLNLLWLACCLLFLLVVHSGIRTSFADTHVLIDTDSQKYRELKAELISKHSFTPEELMPLFSQIVREPQVIQLMDRQQHSVPLLSYFALLFTPAIIDKGQDLLVEHRQLLDSIEREVGVDREYLIAIWAIETRFGQNIGKFNVFRSLNTLFDGYPRRSAFFRRELIEFLLLCREQNMDPTTLSGSYAGALGQTQFMPSSFREYGISFDDDDTVDVFHSVPDILASIANYLKRHGWQQGDPLYVNLGPELPSARLRELAKQGRRGKIAREVLAELIERPIPEANGTPELSIIHVEVTPLPGSSKQFLAIFPNFRAITSWNRSNRFAMAVIHLARAISTP